jgi:hypothetical protein
LFEDSFLAFAGTELNNQNHGVWGQAQGGRTRARGPSRLLFALGWHAAWIIPGFCPNVSARRGSTGAVILSGQAGIFDRSRKTPAQNDTSALG